MTMTVTTLAITIDSMALYLIEQGSAHNITESWIRRLHYAEDLSWNRVVWKKDISNGLYNFFYWYFVTCRKFEPTVYTIVRRAIAENPEENVMQTGNNKEKKTIWLDKVIWFIFELGVRFT